MPYFNNEHNDNEHIDYNTDDQLTEYDTDNEGDDMYNSIKYHLITYEIYNSNLHGCTDCDGHYLVHIELKKTNYFNNKFIKSLYKHNKRLAYNLRIGNSRIMHPFIRNYVNLLETKSISQVQIAQCIMLPGGEIIAILKTFYIRIIQRAWKKIFALRVKIQMKKRHPTNLLYRARHGVWPRDCLNAPSLRGLLIKKY